MLIAACLQWSSGRRCFLLKISLVFRRKRKEQSQFPADASLGPAPYAWSIVDEPGHFEYSQETQWSQHWHTEGLFRIEMCPDHFKYGSNDHLLEKKTYTKPIEQTGIVLGALTTKSNILNEEAKYWFTPRPYILKSISKTNKPRKTNSAISRGRRRILAEIISRWIRTEKISEELLLSIMFDSHADRIEKDQNDDRPVECLGFHKDTDSAPKRVTFLCSCVVPGDPNAYLITRCWIFHRRMNVRGRSGRSISVVRPRLKALSSR